MSYSYKMESRFFFWILSVLFTTFIFSLFYFFQVFGERLNNTLPFIISLVILFFLFLVGLNSLKTTIYFYKFVNKPDNFKKLLTTIDIDDTEENISLMIKRFKEVFFNLNLADKEKSISIIRRTVGFTKESAMQVYLILKNINFTKTILIISGVLISIIIYLILVKIPFFLVLKETKFIPLAISLVILLIFIFESVLISKLPNNFYLNLVNINKKQLKENKKEIDLEENTLEGIFKEREEKRDSLRNLVSQFLSMGIKKKDLLEILDSKQINVYGLKDLIMQAPEVPSLEDKKISFKEVSKKLETILDFYSEIKKTDSKILDLKKKIDEIKAVQETIEKINSKEWDYYRHIKFNLPVSKKQERNITDDIVKKIHYKKELKKDPNKLIDSLYEAFLPYAESLNKNKITTILISRGYSYEVVLDLLDRFKKNNIDLDKNNKSVQDKIISKINSLYDNFKE